MYIMLSSALIPTFEWTDLLLLMVDLLTDLMMYWLTDRLTLTDMLSE